MRLVSKLSALLPFFFSILLSHIHRRASNHHPEAPKPWHQEKGLTMLPTTSGKLLPRFLYDGGNDAKEDDSLSSIKIPNK